jgi:hypothetical protein
LNECASDQILPPQVAAACIASRNVFARMVPKMSTMLAAFVQKMA